MTVYRCPCPCHGSEWGVPIADVIEAAVACDTCKNDHVAVFKPDFPPPKPWVPDAPGEGEEAP